MYKDLNEFLITQSSESKYKAALGERGGYVEFGNSSGKAFTLGLSTIQTIFLDILNNINAFTDHKKYVEQEWRDLGATYFQDLTANTLSTVQTKPLFLTLCKIINWANPEMIPENQEVEMNLSADSLTATLSKLGQVIEEFTPQGAQNNISKCTVEDKYANVFAKKVLFYLNEYDYLERLMPYIKPRNDFGNSSIVFEDKTLTSILRVSDTALSEEEYSSGGKPRNFSDPLLNEKIGQYAYVSTEWTSGKVSRLELEDFQYIIASIYPEFVFYKDGDKYCLGKLDTQSKEKKFTLNKKINGLLDFKYKNILLKGVPGTGKSHLIDKIITDADKLNLKKNDHNILRINIHSASSNADLMQGIGIGTHEKQIVYQEKQGLILNHIRKAIASPLQPFVIVLEEIQENSLNELIGDLIYLIEDSKRAAINAKELGEFEDIEGFVEDFIEKNPATYYVEIPYLVSTETRYKKMILPNNLYIFCTSNYRDDKKVIEDNLLRRFEVIEVYPAYKETIGKMFKSKEVSDFLKKLNNEIVQHFQKAGEIHPDRFMIGHAIWLDVENKKDFYAKLLKVATEFKDIRELDYESDLKPVLMAIDSYPLGIDKTELKLRNYKELIEHLQNKCYSDLFGSGKEESAEAIGEKELAEDSNGTIDLSGDGEEESVEPAEDEELPKVTQIDPLV